MMAKRKAPEEPLLAAWLGDTGKGMATAQVTDALDALYAKGPEEKTIAQALAKLETALEEALPKLAFYELIPNSPVGPIWVAVSAGKLIAVEYDLSEEDFLGYLDKHFEVRARRSAPETAKTIQGIIRYLQGEARRLNLQVDLSASSPFQRTVLEATAKVPRGQVATYAEIAKQIGKPKAFRAVGQALRHNPIPIVIPCHRVIASDGTMGGYAGKMGDPRKVKLLKLEGVMLA